MSTYSPATFLTLRPSTRPNAPEGPYSARHSSSSSPVSDVRKGMDALVEAGNPEYFAWLSDQGMLPIEEVKRQLRIFGEQILQIELAKGKTTTRFAHANEDRRPPNIGSP